MIDVRLLITIFVATLPMLGAVLWNLMEVKSIRSELLQIRGEIIEIRKSMQSLAERIATLEERDRWEHPLVKP